MPALFIEDLSSPALQEFLRECDTAILPIGSVETHGPHLSLCADPLVAEGILKRAAPRIEANVIILPMIYYAIVCQHGFTRNPAYPGIIGVREETLIKYLIDIAGCLHRDGIRKLMIYNGHGGNSAVLPVACVDIEKELPGFYCFVYYVVTGMDVAAASPDGSSGHGGAWETSMNLALAPEHVWLETNPPVAEGHQVPLEKRANLQFFPDWVYSTGGYGYRGDPKLARVEDGEMVVEGALAELVPTVEELARLDVAALDPVEKPNEPFG